MPSTSCRVSFGLLMTAAQISLFGSRQERRQRVRRNSIQRLLRRLVDLAIRIVEQLDEDAQLFVRANRQAALRRQEAHIARSLAALEEFYERTGAHQITVAAGMT